LFSGIIVLVEGSDQSNPISWIYLNTFHKGWEEPSVAANPDWQ
jgi:hypothetical protein